jgi:hypothetical protein
VTAAEFKKTAGAIFDSTLGASAASIDVTGISNTYAHLMVTLYARGDTAATTAAVAMRFNGDAATNYDYQQLRGQAAAASAGETFAATIVYIGDCPANTAGANLFGATEVFIPHYAGSTNNKQTVTITTTKTATTTGTLAVNVFGGSWRSNAAINQITFFPTAGNFVAGTRVTIHALGA